jgi:hypothetical protein
MQSKRQVNEFRMTFELCNNDMIERHTYIIMRKNCGMSIEYSSDSRSGSGSGSGSVIIHGLVIIRSRIVRFADKPDFDTENRIWRSGSVIVDGLLII